MNRFFLVAIPTCLLSFSLVVMAKLHTWHWADFSQNSKLETLSHINWELSDKSLNITHFLTGTCSCSEEIVNYLESKSPFHNSEINEQVILLDTEKDHDFAKRLKKKNYEVTFADREKMEENIKEALLGVPLLLIHNQAQEVLYIGGYDNKTITPFSKISIKPIIENALLNKKSKSKPIKGCVVSQKYQKLMDPLGLKYAER